MAPKADEGLPPLPGADDTPAEPAQAGLGQSSAEHAFGGDPAKALRGKRNGRGGAATGANEPTDPAQPAEPANAAA